MKKGFTLIELLVVVLIIGILSAVALPQYRIAVEKSRAVEAITNMATLREQADLYILQNGLPSGSPILYEQFSTVELSGIIDKEEEMGIYFTKNFVYDISVTNTGPYLAIFRGHEAYPSAEQETYIFFSTKTPCQYCGSSSPVNGWYNYCMTNESDLGRKICKQFEGSGWKYVDSDLV